MHVWKLISFDDTNKVVRIRKETKEQVVITPKIETEYKVVLLDRNLAQYQPGSQKPLVSDPTYIQLSISQDPASPEYTKGAVLKANPANVEVFTDEACQDKLDLSKPIENAKLTGAEPYKIYLRGKTKGKFTLELKLEDPADKQFKLETAEMKLGVVELLMTPYKVDDAALDKLEVDPNQDPIDKYYTDLKNLALPDQIESGDEEKVKTGCLLHAQDGDNFGRCKLMIKKLDSDQWPDDCDDYQINLGSDNTSGEVEIWDSEWSGNRIALPFKIKVGDLKKADREIWIQGKTETDAWRDGRLDLGLDRSEGGLPKKLKTKADWMHFTVVKIQEVKVDYTTPPNRPTAFDSAAKRFFINFDPANGSNIAVGAKLSKPIKDVQIHFMLAPHKDNRKAANWGIDMPGTWPWHQITWDLKRIDKTDPKKLIHLSGKTDASGYAKKELSLSRFGGDKFQPGAYLTQDPHLAKYIHGHPDLEAKKPKLATDDTQVWRKFWFQITKAQGFAVPLPAAAVAAYERVKTIMTHDQTVEFVKATAPARTFYSKYIVEGGNSGTEIAVVGSHNKNALAAMFQEKPDQPVKNHLIMCEKQYDEGGLAGPFDVEITGLAAGSYVELDMNEPVFDPPLQGGDMIDQLYWYRDSDPATRHNIPKADAKIPQPRNDFSGSASNSVISIKVPAIAPPPAAGEKIFIVAKCEAADGPYLGESFGKHSLIVYDPTDVPDYNDTVAHEIGHGFNQTPRPGTQPDSAHIPDHPNQADRGQGNHCQENDGVDPASGATKYKCLMYDSGPMKWGLHRFCDTCHPYLLVEDMSSF